MIAKGKMAVKRGKPAYEVEKKAAKRRKSAVKRRKPAMKRGKPADSSLGKAIESEAPEGWELYEEEQEHPEEGESSGGREVSNNLLWLLFFAILALFIASPFLFKNAPQELRHETINGIDIAAPESPRTAIMRLNNAHIVGRRLDDSSDSHDALNEILVVMGQSSASSSSSYTLSAGITGKTGISINRNNIRIEGANRREFWTAVWTFTSILSGTEIDSDIPLYGVQKLPEGRSEIYLVQNLDNSCPDYGRIISAEGDIIPPLFRTAELGFNAFHYYSRGGNCSPADNESDIVPCPEAGNDTLVLTMSHSDSNRISVSKNSILFEYADCESVDKISSILGDMLYPNRVSAIASMQVPLNLQSY